MARYPLRSLTVDPVYCRASLPADSTNPLSSEATVFGYDKFAFQSVWLSFQNGLNSSVQTEPMWKDVIGLFASGVHTSEQFGLEGSQPGLVGAGPCTGAVPLAGLNWGKPSKDWSAIPLAAQ